MPFLRPVNLPLPLILQSCGSIGLGLYLTFLRRSPYVSSNGYSLLVPAKPPPRTADTITVLGIMITALQAGYLVTSYMPLEENQFIHAGVPIRLALSAMMATVCVVNRKTMSKDGFRELAILTVIDAVAAIQTGLQLGRFDGMVKNAERWL